MNLLDEFKYFWRECPLERGMLLVLFSIAAFIHVLFIIYELLFRTRRLK